MKRRRGGGTARWWTSLRDSSELARPLAVLERAAARGTLVVIPLFGMMRADAADVAAVVLERPVAGRADQHGRHDGWRRGLVPHERATERDAALVRTRLLEQRFGARQLCARSFANGASPLTQGAR